MKLRYLPLAVSAALTFACADSSPTDTLGSDLLGSAPYQITTFLPDGTTSFDSQFSSVWGNNQLSTLNGRYVTRLEGTPTCAASWLFHRTFQGLIDGEPGLAISASGSARMVPDSPLDAYNDDDVQHTWYGGDYAVVEATPSRWVIEVTDTDEYCTWPDLAPEPSCSPTPVSITIVVEGDVLVDATPAVRPHRNFVDVATGLPTCTIIAPPYP